MKTLQRGRLTLAILGFTSATLALPQRGEGAAVDLHFAARVGRQPVQCATTYEGVGLTRASLFLQDFRVYVSALRLLTRDGREVPVALTPDAIWQDEQVALLDFEDGTGNCNGNRPTNDRVRGTVPDGEYVGLIFEIGVPFAINHQDPTLAAAPLNFSALTWPWAGGYKFTTIDFDTQPTDKRQMIGDGEQKHSASGFSVHLGSTECASSGPRVPPKTPCGNPNRPVYRLEPFNPAKDLVVLDLGELLAGTDVTVNMARSPSGCMSSPKDDDCIDIMSRFGLVFRGKLSSGQRFVRGEAKP